MSFGIFCSFLLARVFHRFSWIPWETVPSQLRKSRQAFGSPADPDLAYKDKSPRPQGPVRAPPYFPSGSSSPRFLPPPEAMIVLWVDCRTSMDRVFLILVLAIRRSVCFSVVYFLCRL